jgi:hypothetical protein
MWVGDLDLPRLGIRFGYEGSDSLVVSRHVRLTNLLVRTSEARRLGQLSSTAFFLEARSVLRSHRHSTPLSLCFSGCDFCFCFNVLVNSPTALPGLGELDHCVFFYGSLTFCENLFYLGCLLRFSFFFFSCGGVFLCFSLSRITFSCVCFWRFSVVFPSPYVFKNAAYLQL